jgi:hypothetical protein
VPSAAPCIIFNGENKEAFIGVWTKRREVSASVVKPEKISNLRHLPVFVKPDCKSGLPPGNHPPVSIEKFDGATTRSSIGRISGITAPSRRIAAGKTSKTTCEAEKNAGGETRPGQMSGARERRFSTGMHDKRSTVRFGLRDFTAVNPRKPGDQALPTCPHMVHMHKALMTPA